MDNLYLDIIVDRYKHPTNRGWLEKPTVVKKTHNPSCGDSFEIALSFKDDRVITAKWKGEGCAISTVSIDAFCEWAIGKTSQQLSAFSQQQIRDLTGIETITQAREKCLFLPLSAL